MATCITIPIPGGRHLAVPVPTYSIAFCYTVEDASSGDNPKSDYERLFVTVLFRTKTLEDTQMPAEIYANLKKKFNLVRWTPIDLVSTAGVRCAATHRFQTVKYELKRGGAAVPIVANGNVQAVLLNPLHPEAIRGDPVPNEEEADRMQAEWLARAKRLIGKT